MIYTKECLNCKQIFICNINKRKFCSQKCYKTFRYNKYLEKTKPHKCLFCDNIIYSTKYYKKYCSQPHKLEYFREKYPEKELIIVDFLNYDFLRRTYGSKVNWEN